LPIIEEGGYKIRQVVRCEPYDGEINPLSNLARFAISIAVQKSPFYNYMVISDKE
jgi:hypothetical protein